MGAGSGSEADVIPNMIAESFGQSALQLCMVSRGPRTRSAVPSARPILMRHGFDRAGTYVPLSVVLFSVPCFVAAFMQLLLRSQGEPPTLSTIAI
jgi:hypothetical protein